MPQFTGYYDIITHQMNCMSSILLHKEESGNLDNYSTSVKTINQVSNISTKAKGKNHSGTGLFLSKLIANIPYPNFRFFCPFCASLDVFITIDNSDDFSVDCLDCKKRWIDSRSWKN